MGITTDIGWTDASHNFWYGCLKVSPGCKNCYMYRDMKRYGRNPLIITRAKGFNKPLTWKTPMKVFVNSWSDFFIDQADDWRDDAWKIIRQTPHLTYQILTKRPENISNRLPVDWGDGWANVWLGVSVEGQEYIDRIKVLADIPAIVHFVSYEPALAELDIVLLLKYGIAEIDWLIAGGESGYNPRPVDRNWITDIKNQCLEWDVPFFFKQWGGNRKIDGVWGGRELDGVKWNQFPK